MVKEAQILARKLTSIEFCAGAGGQALGLEKAGFKHQLLVDNDDFCIQTLRANRPKWNSICADMNGFDASDYHGVDLFAGGLPCPPFSVAGKQLGAADERNLFPAALEIIKVTQPKFVLIENVRGFLSNTFAQYRDFLRSSFEDLDYSIDWRLYNACDFGVPQLRPRVAIVAAKKTYWSQFSFPEPSKKTPSNIGETLLDLMGENGWDGAQEWAKNANKIAPTIVGGSKKHGGPDLGPTRAREAWLKLGVNGKSIADSAPEKDFDQLPRLTPRMIARIQGFPDDWAFSGKKTNACRQIGNAFPPPVAAAIGKEIRKSILRTESISIAAE